MVERNDLSGLRIELMKILDLLRSELNRQRDRGRTPEVDVVQGNVIEEGEAEGLVVELRCSLEQSFDGKQSNTVQHRGLDTYPGLRSDSDEISWPPLLHAAKAFDLSRAEYGALVLALAVELDSRFGRLIAFLNDHVGRTRPTLGMATLLAGMQGDPFVPYPSQWLNRTVFRDGLLELDGEGPLPGLTFRVPREMLLRLTTGATSTDTTPHVEFCSQPSPVLSQLVLPDVLREQTTNWAHQLRTVPNERPMVVVGPIGSGRRTLAQCIAFQAGWSSTIVEFDSEQLVDRLRVARRESRWHRSALILRLKESSAFTQLDWSMLWNELRDVRRPLFLILPSASSNMATAEAIMEPAVISLADSELSQRTQLWQALLPSGHNVPLAACDRLAARFRFGPGRIHRVIRRSLSQAELLPESERGLTASQLEASCRAIGGAAMGSLAQKINLPYRRSDLIISDQLQSEFDLAIAWVERQRQVLDDWGFAKRVPYGRGLTALFAGPPGTGKTMAAQVLAKELGVDLFRVDFSRLMSKWIGETEKNLSQLFDEAHSAGVALFFDEGDAVAGKRSEVKDAHDRYANLEISYLLQRMEEHEGISIFATNRLGDLDEAFTRRFHFVLDFPKPSAEQRQRIWEGMIPPQVQRAEDLNLERCAQQYELTGGEIKNVVLAAAFLAAQSGQALSAAHVQAGVQRELLKSGRLSDM